MTEKSEQRQVGQSSTTSIDQARSKVEQTAEKLFGQVTISTLEVVGTVLETAPAKATKIAKSVEQQLVNAQAIGQLAFVVAKHEAGKRSAFLKSTVRSIIRPVSSMTEVVVEVAGVKPFVDRFTAPIKAIMPTPKQEAEETNIHTRSLENDTQSLNSLESEYKDATPTLSNPTGTRPHLTNTWTPVSQIVQPTPAPTYRVVWPANSNGAMGTYKSMQSQVAHQTSVPSSGLMSADSSEVPQQQQQQQSPTQTLDITDNPDEIIANYDLLATSQILDLVSGLNPSQARILLVHEELGRRRKTIIDRLHELV